VSAGKKKRPSVPQRAPAPARVRRRAAPPRIAKPVKAVKRAEPVSAPRAKTLRAASANGGWTRDEAPTRGDAPLRLLAPDGAWLGEGSGPDLPDATLLALFKGMLEVRLLDGRMLNLQRQGRIGFYGQSTGQEAAIIGSAAAATAQDWVAPALREAGVAVWRGLPLARLIAQCMARDGEPSRGRQMPCHHTFRAGNFISMSSVIATQIVHATGIALAAKLKRDPVVAIGYLGDSTTSEHDFHCALNFAAVWKAPVVFVCQNNQWAISVPVSRQTAARTLAAKAVAYGMPGVRVDGNDVLAVHFATKRAVERARGGGGPTFLEALTYRRMGHSSSDDPTKYRDSSEVAKWEQLDPIDRMRRHLLARGLLTKAKEERLEEEFQAAISAAITEAEALPEPPPESLVEDVFATPTPQLLAQREELLRSLGEGGAPTAARAHGR